MKHIFNAAGIGITRTTANNLSISFTIEKISNGYVSELNGVRRYFNSMEDLLSYALLDNLENQFNADEKAKIIFSFKIEEVDILQ